MAICTSCGAIMNLEDINKHVCTGVPAGIIKTPVTTDKAV